MIATILTAAAVYVATGIDYLVILILLFSQVKKGQVKHIWIGQYIGTAIVIGASLLVAQGGCKFNSSAMGYRTTWTFTTLLRCENVD